jgi:hypothetical protein
MKGKIFSVILLACVVLSTSVNASPIIDFNNQKVLSSYFYRLAVRIMDSVDSNDDTAIDIVGGDADDYANGRTEESSKDDLINDAGRENKDGKK